MVIRMRIYDTTGPNPSATQIFFEKVKPVHERHGATFLGRFIDEKGRHVVMWSYPDRATMFDIQQRVEKDEETIRNRELRISSGLHGVPFEEFLLDPTQPG
jgi:hypothetical protein